MEIQQGNVINSKMMLQLRPDMTKSQVRFILGTPLIQDSFHKDRWDYLYQLRKGGVVVEQRRVILGFENDLLKRVRGDVIPADSNAPAAAAAAVVAPKVEDKPKTEDKKSLTDSLKFWQSDKEAEQAAAADRAGFIKELEVPPALLPATAAATTSALMAPADAKDGSASAQALLPAQTQPMAETLIAPTPASPVAPAAVRAANAPASGAAETAVAASAISAEPSKADSAKLDPAEAVNARVYAWADAWRQKDISRYFSFYAAKFVPDTATSKSAWIEQRKQRLSKTGSISVEISDVKVYAKDTQAKVDFIQHYSSEGYSDNVAKTLQFELIYGSWMIVKESAGTNVGGKSKKAVASPVTEDSPTPKLTPEQKSDTMPAPVEPPAKPVAEPLPAVAPPVAAPAAVASPVQKGAAEQAPVQQAPSQTKQAQQKSAPQKPDDKKAADDAADENPGLFERMLEKIGF